MIRARRKFLRSGALAATVAVALVASALLSGTGAGAAVRKAAVDKNAVLTVGTTMNDNGGVFFQPSNGPSNPYARTWLDQIYDTMIHDSQDGKGTPGLATKWSVPDATTVELTLREGIKFSDGTALTADVVKANWDRVFANPPFGARDAMLAVTNVAVVSPTQLKLTLNKPLAQKLVDGELRSAYYLGVAPVAALQAGTLNTKPIGAGPYQLKSYSAGGDIVLERNPNYYDPKAQKLAGIVLKHVALGAPNLQALQTGTVDLIWQVSADQIAPINGSKDLVAEGLPAQSVRTLHFCTSKPPFDKKEVRQAVAWAINRQAINEAGYEGTAKPTSEFLTETNPFYDKALNNTYTYNVKKAKALLAAAGVQPGTKISMITGNQLPNPTVAEAIQADLKAVGFDVELLVSSSLVAEVNAKQPNIVIALENPDLLTVTFGANPSTLNHCFWQNAQATQMLVDANDPTKTLAQRKEIWTNFQKLIQEESPIVSMLADPNVIGRTEQVQNVKVIYPTLGGPMLFGVYMTK